LPDISTPKVVSHCVIVPLARYTGRLEVPTLPFDAVGLPLDK
jgi:hypothetical protein